jgi:amino acid transporter
MLSRHLTAASGIGISGFGMGACSADYDNDGFADLSFAGGEVKDPERNLPRALIAGTLMVLVIYLLANAAYLYVNPIAVVAKSRLIAADTLLAMFGQIGVSIVSVIVMVSTFGSLNGTMLVNPRIFFAMADDGLFFKSIAKVHPRFKTPYTAVALAGALGVAFVLAGTFEQLTDTFVKAMLPFYALSVAGIYKLRRTHPTLKRPYLVTGYPVVPMIYILGVIYLTINSLLTDTIPTALVFVAVLAGIPVYYAFFHNRANA